MPATEKKLMEAKEKPPELFMGEGTVLLVVDEDMVLDVGEQILKASGYGVLVARNGWRRDLR